MSYDAIVIGAGVFGMTTARHLANNGRKVLLIDDGRPGSGTAPSAFLMKPSWFSGLGKEVHEPALKTLAWAYHLLEEEFVVGALGLKLSRQKCFRIAAADVLSPVVHANIDRLVGTVREVGPGFVAMGGTVAEAPTVVVAAGVWCSELMAVDGLHGKRGLSLSYDAQLADNIIRPFMPYRQIVAFNDTDRTVWAGDGTAIKTTSGWDEFARTALTRERIESATGLRGGTPRVKVGVRPFAKLDGKPCLLEKRAEGLWLATGGGKNGTIAAGWAAHVVEEATR